MTSPVVMTPSRSPATENTAMRPSTQPTTTLATSLPSDFRRSHDIAATPLTPPPMRSPETQSSTRAVYTTMAYGTAAVNNIAMNTAITPPYQASNDGESNESNDD